MQRPGRYNKNMVGEPVKAMLVKTVLPVYEKIRLMGVRERRKPGPMAAIILERYFEKNGEERKAS